MVHHYHYSIDEIEGLIPFERDLYVSMLNNYIEEQKEKNK
jgi:hypothetical protein